MTIVQLGGLAVVAMLVPWRQVVELVRGIRDARAAAATEPEIDLDREMR